MIGSLLKNACNVLAGGILLAVPVYSVCSILPGTSTPVQAVLAEGDDPIRNGLHIVDEPVSPNRQTVISSQPEVLPLTDWMFTSKGKPSPYG